MADYDVCSAVDLLEKFAKCLVVAEERRIGMRRVLGAASVHSDSKLSLRAISSINVKGLGDCCELEMKTHFNICHTQLY
jgi:hypothetical protein